MVSPTLSNPLLFRCKTDALYPLTSKNESPIFQGKSQENTLWRRCGASKPQRGGKMVGTKRVIGLICAFLMITACSGVGNNSRSGGAYGMIKSSDPGPLLMQNGSPVDWWFVFKFNGAAFPGCVDDNPIKNPCLFGGTPQTYRDGFSQQFVYVYGNQDTTSSLQKSSLCVGKTTNDPVGATFDQVYNGTLNYVIWNDQFYNDPLKSQDSPWGHAKGMLAWNDEGEGFVMQVSTPSWPASGSVSHPRSTDGNTLGCVGDDDVKVSQHFFALKLNKDDVVMVLKGLQNASVVTDPTNLQIVKNGGPSDIQQLAGMLGKESTSTTNMVFQLSSGFQMISKPSGLHVPPWQLVSATLGGVPLRTATWWADPKIATTTASTPIACWNDSLGQPGAVEIASTGQWQGTSFSLEGGAQLDANHAKLGVSTNPDQPYVIFGDLNQQGSLSGPNCNSSQNGRGGTFYVIKNNILWDGIYNNLIKGKTADIAP